MITAIATAPALLFVLVPQINGLVTGAYRVADFYNLVSDTSGSTVTADSLDPKKRAFLEAIADLEGTGEDGYNIMFTYATFDDFSRHPAQINCDGSLCSDAAGKYQFLSTTYQPIADELGLKDFSPESQDKAVLALIDSEFPEVWDLLEAGKVEEAFCTASTQWESLPCATGGQNPKTPAEAVTAYQENLKEAVAKVADSKPGIKAIANIDTQEPAVGEVLGKFIVTSGWGPRSSPGGVGSSYHMGLDVAMADGSDATGQPVYTIAAPGETVEVRCWAEPLAGLNASWGSKTLGYGFDYGHLHTCNPGTYKAGEKIGEIGNTGSATTGPHLHMQQRKNGTSDPTTGDHMPVYRTFAEMAVGTRLNEKAMGD